METAVLDTLDVNVKVPLSVQLIALHLRRGRKPADIAKICNVSRQAVHDYVNRHSDALSPLLPNSDDLMALTSKYVANKAMGKIIDVLDDATKKDLMALNAISGTHVEKYLLLSGKATEIHDNRTFSVSISAKISEADARINKIKAALGVTD